MVQKMGQDQIRGLVERVEDFSDALQDGCLILPLSTTRLLTTTTKHTLPTENLRYSPWMNSGLKVPGGVKDCHGENDSK